MPTKRKVYSRLREQVYRINLERESYGAKLLTQTDIVESTGLTHKTVSLWMNGGKPLKRIDTEAWMSIAETIGVEPDDLLRVEEEKESLLVHPANDFSVAVMN